MAKKTQPWKAGDVFLVETKDHLKVVGQILADEREEMGCPSCAFFDIRVKDEFGVKDLSELPIDRAFSILFVTPEALKYGDWKVVGRLPVSIPRSRFPYEHLRKKGWVGASMYGSVLVEDFLNAYYALSPWDACHDPAEYDGYLLSPDKKPTQLMYKSSKPSDQPNGLSEESATSNEAVDEVEEEDEDSVFVHLKLSDDKYGTPQERDRIRKLSRELERAIESKGVGELDGDEFGAGECTLFMYGPDANALFSVIEPMLRQSPVANGGWAVKRYGHETRPDRKEVRIDL
jgi:hypothetical protein